MARTSSKIVKTIPNTETGSMTTCFTKHLDSGDKYLITQNPLKSNLLFGNVLKMGLKRLVYLIALEILTR